MTLEDKFTVYRSAKKDIEAALGEGVLNIAMAHNCMEVMTKEISKVCLPLA